MAARGCIVASLHFCLPTYREFIGELVQFAFDVQPIDVILLLETLAC